MTTFAERERRDCDKGGGHEWAAVNFNGSGYAIWGVVIGVSRCLKCGTLSRSEHFTSAQSERTDP